ncbi:MAG: hypothetical protein AAFZ09_16865, partial [Pseudomonadota bacterium]
RGPGSTEMEEGDTVRSAGDREHDRRIALHHQPVEGGGDRVRDPVDPAAGPAIDPAADPAANPVAGPHA